MQLNVQIDSFEFHAIAAAARCLGGSLGVRAGRRQVEVRVADDTFLFPSISSAARWIGEFVQFMDAAGRPLAVPQSVRRAFVAALAAQFAACDGGGAAQPAVPKAPPPSLEQSVVALLDALDDAIDLPADLTPDDVLHLVPRALPRLRGRPDLVARKLLLKAVSDDLHPMIRVSRIGSIGFHFERKEARC